MVFGHHLNGAQPPLKSYYINGHHIKVINGHQPTGAHKTQKVHHVDGALKTQKVHHPHGALKTQKVHHVDGALFKGCTLKGLNPPAGKKKSHLQKSHLLSKDASGLTPPTL